jgi:hypothetical protein
MERLEHDLLFRWFVSLGVDDTAWGHSAFSKNRDLLLSALRRIGRRRVAAGIGLGFACVGLAFTFAAAHPARSTHAAVLGGEWICISGQQLPAARKPIGCRQCRTSSGFHTSGFTRPRGHTSTEAGHCRTSRKAPADVIFKVQRTSPNLP